MAEGGVPDDPFHDPLLDDKDDDDDNEVDTTRPFYQPGYTSTPYHGGEEIGMRTHLHETSGLPETSYDETSFGGDGIPLLGDFIHKDDKPALIERAKDFIKKKFPRVDFSKLVIGFGKKPGNETTVMVLGEKGGETKIFKNDGRGFLKKFTDSFKKDPGPPAESLIADENEEIRQTRQSLRDAEKQLKEAERLDAQNDKWAQEAKNLRIRLEQTQAKIDQFGGSNVENESELRELQQRARNYREDYENAKKELAEDKETRRNALERGLNDTKTLDELKEQEAEIKRQNEQDQEIIDDTGTSPSDRQAAEDRVAERAEELARLQTEIAEREEALPLRERVKAIFKKYGVTITAIVLAAGVTIVAVVGAITNSLKTLGKGLGNGLKKSAKKRLRFYPG